MENGSSVVFTSLMHSIYADFRHWSLHSHHSLLTASCTNTTTVAQEHWKVSSTTVCHISTFLTFLLAQGRWLRPSCRSTMALYSVGMLCLLCLILSMVWKSSYSVPVSEPGNRKDCGRKVFRHKYLGLHGWAYSHSHLCGCCRPASGHTVRGVSERGPVINQGPHQIQN